MKKSLIALAVLAASGAAMAQSSVTLYGLADIGVGSVKSTDTTGGITTSTRQSKVDSGGFYTSRLGFKGSEDLGGGLKAEFLLEGAIGLDTGTFSGFNRQSWVGLSGGFGKVQLGKMWSPYDNTLFDANDTFTSSRASSYAVFAPYEDNAGNTIYYTSPTFGGITGSLAYTLGEDKTATNSASSITSMSLNYVAGPIVAGIAYQVENDKNPAAGTPFTDLSTVLAALGVPTSKVQYTLINGSYDLGAAKLIAGYNNVKFSSSSLASDVKSNAFNLGVEVPLSSSLVLGAGYAQNKYKSGGTDAAKVTGYSFAAKYALSKRTFVYGAATNTKSELTGTPEGSKTTLFALGVQHAF